MCFNKGLKYVRRERERPCFTEQLPPNPFCSCSLPLCCTYSSSRGEQADSRPAFLHPGGVTFSSVPGLAPLPDSLLCSLLAKVHYRRPTLGAAQQDASMALFFSWQKPSSDTHTRLCPQQS